MNKKYLLILLLPFFYCIQSCNNQQRSNNNNQDTTIIDKAGLSFIKNVDELSQAEIKAATIAESTSKSPEVVNFAHKLINEYNNSLQKLQDIKAKASITATDEISQAHKKLIDSIAKLPGAQFDRAYMKLAVDNSGKLTVLYVNASQDKSQVVSTYARKIMPALQIQLDSARKISASLK